MVGEKSMTVRKIERIIVSAFGQWTPECRAAAREISKSLAAKPRPRKAGKA